MYKIDSDQQNNSNITEGSSADRIREIIHHIFVNKYIIILFFMLFTVMGFLYLRYAPRQYKIQGSIIVGDSQDSPTLNLNDFLGGNLDLFGSQANLENEIGILKSYAMISRVLDSLDFQVNYFEKGVVNAVELYGYNRPFVLSIDENHNQPLNSRIEIFLKQDNTFDYEVELFKVNDIDLQEKIRLPKKQVVKGKGSFGQVCEGEYYRFTISKNKLYKQIDKSFEINKQSYIFIIRDRDGLLEEYQSKLSVKPFDKKSTLLRVQIIGEVPSKEIDFLNTLQEIYITRELEDNSQLADKTIRFIDSQLNIIADSLYIAESELERFRNNTSPVDLTILASNAVEQMKEITDSKSEASIAKGYYKYLLGYLQDSAKLDRVIAPASIGVPDILLNTLTLELQALYSKKVSLMNHVAMGNPELKILNQQIEELKRTIINNVQNSLKSIDVTL